MDFTQPISTKQQAESFLKQMIEEGYNYPFDDDPETIMNSGEPLFTSQEVPHVRQRVSELRTFDWGDSVDPDGFVLDLEDPGWRTR